MAKTKVDAMWEDLKSKGYFQSDKATFDKYFYAPGDQGYKNRKALYDDLHNKGYLQSPTYEDFAQRIGLHATGNAGNASAHGTTQSMLPADVAERRIRTAKQPTPLNKSKARQRLMQQQQAIQRQQKQWQQQADRLRQYDEKRSTTLPGGMERLGERAQEHLATGQAAPVPIAPNPEVVRGDMVMGDDGRMQQSYQVGSTPYSSRAGAEAVLYRQAHPLEDELQQAYLERERLQEQMRNVDSGTHRFNIGSMSAGMPSAYGTYAAVFNSPEFAMLSSAYHKNEQRIKTLERERDADGFWSTLGKELFSLDTWDFGAQEFMDASTMMRYFDRDDLTDQERGARQSMLENAFAKNAADQQYGQNDTFMQRAASITAQALPFVAQFLATGGMSGLTEGGAELGAKAAARWATGKVGEWMLKNTGVLLGDLAAGFAMANTVGMLQTGADIMGRRQGQLMMGPDGSFYFADGKSWGRSIWEGEAANTLEYYTEMLGAHLDGLVAGAIGRAALRPEGKLLGGWFEELGDKVGLSALSDVFSRITGSELQAVTTNILRRGGVNEIPSEIFEEESNLLLNALLVGDNKISDLWDPKTQADIWGGMCLSVGFMQSPGVIGGAYQTAQYYRYKHATDVADQKARARLGDEQWDALKTLLDGASNQEIPVVIANMRADSDMSTLGKTAVMDYAKNLLQMRGYNLRTAAEAKSQLQQPDEAQPAVKDESGTSFAEGYNAGEQDMEPIKNRLEAAQRTLTQMGYDVSALNGRQLQDFSQESLAGMPDDERAALLEFFNARAAFEGMRQKVNDDVDTQVQHASDLVDMQTNRDTHMMHRAVLNNDQEVYVTVGRLVMTGDGTMVDTEASDESLFGYNTTTGEVGQYTPQDFKSVDDPVNPEQAKAESAENIRREVAGRAAAAINGDLAFNDGDEFDILGGDNATHHIQVLGQQDEGHVVASIDGGDAQVIPKNELQAMHDNLKDAVKDMEDAAADAENTEEPLQSNGPLDNTAPDEERPAEERTAGPAIMPSPGQGNPQEMLNYFRASGISDRVADRTITNNIVAANERLNKAERELNESKETDPQKLVELENAVEAAQRELDYWNAVGRRRWGHEPGETAAQQRPTEQAAAPVAENEMKPVEAAPAVETPAEQEPTEQTPESKPEQRKSLSEETGVLEGDRDALAQSMSPRTLEMIHKIAQQLGLKIRVYNDPNAAGENGYFDGNTNTIWVNTARRTGKLASWVLGHEMTHAMDARATDKKSKVYKDFKRIAVSFVRSVEGIEAYEARIKRTMERYKNAPGVDASKVTRDYIEDEVACDMAGELLAEGPEFMERLFRDATDRNALERVLDAVRDFVDRMLSILNANSDEYRALTILRDSMNKMYNDVKIQGEISNELEPDADAEVETDITPADEDRQERKDRQRAKRVKRKRAKRKSVTAIVEGAGMQASENVKETWKVPQADGTFKEEERWVKRPLLDDQGNVVFRMGDKEFNGNNPVSVEDLEENPDTVLNYMLNDAVNIGKLSEKKARQIRQKYADMLNAYLRRGMTDETGTGFENLENSWMWVGEAAYKTVASNSDEQYSYSLDITRVCKKNEAVIRAISALQVKTGYGVTPGQIMDIYLTTDAEGYQVPCPVCYVFSRYINNGKYATAIVNGMQKYGKYLPGQAEEKDLAWWVDKYNEENAKAKKMKTPIDNANGDVKTILQNIDTLSREITSGTLSDEEREAKLRELHDMDERYRAALDVISQEAMPRWIKAFVLAGSAKDGWRMREDAVMPEDMDDFISHALDIRKTASAMVKYPAITRYRRAGGSAGGKEITFASNNDMGSIAMALGISKSNLDNFNNYYQLALEAGTEEERKALLEKARKRFGDARLYAQRQTLRGGQRMWSWSDNIEALASDVASNLMQLEMLGGALQTYSKQLEGVKMVAAMNGYVNASLMGYGDGVMEVNEDNITTDKSGRRVLAQDITEVNNKGRERIIANAGSPIYRNEDGKDYVLVFDDVVGIDPFGHEGNDGKFRRGLFALNEEYDRAGNILVGMNDIHVRAAMADPRVFFIIPWHASGMSNHILMQMFRVLGVDTENFKATDYTKMQEETNFLERTEKGKLKHKVTQAVRDFWNSHTYEGEFRSGIGHIPNGDRKEGLSKQQLHYRELRDAIFDGTIDNEDKKDWKRQVERDEFLSQVYRQVTTRVDDGKMTEKDKEFIYPYEYWDESSTYDTADINGKRYLEYCRRMGFKPKFTGRYDEKAGYSPEGNFADDPGYWKLLIDRRMYDREGKFQDLTPVDSEGLEPNMYDPKETQKEFNVTEVATNEGAERIADIVYQQEVERSGSMPTPNLNTTLEGAVEQYKDTVKRQAARVKAENDAKKAEEAARIKAEKAAERARKKAEREAERAKQRKSLGDIIEEAVQSAAIPQPEEANDSNIRYSLRTKPAPKKTLPVYKLMRLGDDGKLYPLYIDGAVPIELGQWYDADSPNMEMLVNLPAGVHLINPETGEATSLEDYNKQRGITKKSKYPSAEAVNEATANGMRWVYIEPTKGGQRRFGGEARRYWNLGINGSGTVSTYSMRPGWHAGSLPTMRQIGKGPGRNLRDDRFVWVEGEISADVDYNEEAQGNPDNDIPTHIPVDGFYLKATNANAKASQADRVGWYISGAFKANRIMSDSETRDVIDEWNADPKHKDLQVEYDFPRESGKVFNAETMQLEDDDNGPDGPNGGKRFSISERTDDNGNEVYTETREDGTKDREVVTMPDGSRDVTWFDEAGRKKEVLSYYPNGEVRQVNNYDSEGDLTRLIQYDENRRAIRHWEPRIGTDWERDENGVARGMSNGVEMRPYGSRFSLAPTFYSNAARAVEGVKQEKAKAEQWKAMLTKAGGIKAGEDKWMGLSTWLDEHKGETLTKDEVAQFVRDNAVQMKETHYGEIDDDIIEEKLTPFEDEFNRLMDEAQDATDSIFKSEWGEWAYNQMREHYGDDFEMAFALTETINGYPAIVPNRNFDGALDDAAKYFLGLGSYGDMEDINATRLDFTTPGLKNKREIAFVVPDVEPYQEYDEIHFGPENQGRAIMWVRFGETTDTDGNRVLVIDEVQSNRHQDAREKGYRSNEDYKNVQSFRAKLSKEHPEGWSVDNESARKSGLYILSKEEHEELMRLNSKAYGGENRDGIPAAPFEKNWHEVAMKRMLRLAAEEGFDKVAWTTGMQQAERYDIGNAVERIEKLDDRAFLVYPEDGSPYQELEFDEDGVYRDDDDALLNNKTMADIFGKETAEKLKNLSDGDQLTGEGLRIGGEGMKAFYDKMLPQFMNKYGKRWGVKVGEVTLNTPGKEVMHSVDVNEDMRRSVMQGQPLFSLGVEQERTLMGMHNITAEKLRSALRLGGLANPSMAVINTEVGGFTNFGEISLIPSSDLIASRTGGNAGTWAADAYSPRFPETHRRLGKGGDKKMRSWVKGLKMRQEMEYNTEEQFNDYYNGFNIRDNALVYPFLHEKGLSGEVDYYTHMNVDQRLEDDLREVNGDQWALLKRFDEDEEYKKKLTDIVVGDELKKISKKEGETFQEFRDRRREWAKEIRETLTEEDGYINRNLAEDLLWGQARAYRENGKFSESRTVSNAEQYIRDHGMEDEYQQYFEQKMQELGAELQVYAGSDSQGRSKYKPVSLDQVSKQMKKQGRAGGEGGIFADSPGAIRAKLLTPMKTLDQIRKQKDRLVSHEAFEQFRERYQEELREYADVYARGSMGALADIITSGNMAATAKQYNIDLDADAVAKLNKFKNRVRSLPTEYFETKFERPVMLDEFKKAIIPDDLPLDLQGALQRAGLDVVEYKHGDNADRERVTLDAVKNDDSIRFSISTEEQERQTHSENFKRWFGDWENDPEHASNVVDAEGRPLVVYRGGEKINTFEPDKASRMAMYGPAFYATPSYVDAQEFGKGRTGNADDVQAVYLDIRNPWVDGPCESLGYPKEATMEQARELVDLLTSKGLVDGGIILAKWNDGRVRSLIGTLADAEYEGVERGRGEWWHASAIVQDALKELGYDGVVGRFDIGDGHMVEQVAAFEPTQIKSATENNGEFDPGNPDIRFSVSEESQKIFDTAKRKFGETKDIREAGYVLPDGTMLDFSGRHELDPGTDSSFLAGRRTTDHRAINQISFIYDENGDEVDTGVSSDMPDFIRRGAIRIDNNAGSINLSAAPTMAQRRVLRELIRRNGGDVQVDFGDGWNSDHYVEYEEASAQRVLGDIDRYFDEGIKPESNVRFSLSGDGTVEAYNKAVNMTGRTFNVGGREVKPGLTRYNFQEAFQDAILSVKKLQQVVERHFGIKLPTRENAWMYENRLSSINMHERKSFYDKVYDPMMKIADRILKRGVKEKELNAYLICKHGLERNQVFAMRDANEEANEIVRNGGTPDMQQLIDKYRQRDYSGLTGVTGIQGDITDIEAEAQRIVDEFEQRHGQLCDELWDAIRKATQWSLRKSYQSGMMSAATFDHVRNMFQYYVPLRGWSETTAEDVYSYMMGEHGAFNGVLKKAEGRTSVADDPLATIGNMAESALIQGNRNLLKQHLLRMAQNHPTDVCQVRDVWLVEGPGGVWEPHWPNIPEDATPDEIDQILQDHEADMQQLEASGQAKRVRNNLDIPYRIDPRHVPEHAVVAKVAGVDHVVYINGNPRAAQAINGQTGAGRGTKSGFSRLIDFIFGDVKRFYSSVLTSLNINFSGANFVRDLPHAYAMTFMKQGPLKAAEYIAKSFQVIPWVFKNQLGKTGTSQMDRYFQEFLSSGAVTGYAHINDVDAWKANNKRRFARLSALGKAKVAVPRALGEVINAIGWFSETLELIPRFTAFLVERQAGKDIATATKAAKDITTNFNKKGSEVTPGVWGAVANTLRYMKMFFNPIVQGMYQFVDVASMGKENKWVGPRMVLATMHLPVLGAIVPYLNQFLLEALGGDDDDDYWLLNEYTRRNNVCIFTGNGYLKIPIAPVFRELYGMGEVVATRHAGKADNEKTTIDLIDQLRTMGSVEGQSSYNEWSLARFLLPEHFAPLIDVMNNENFTGGPIYYDNNYKEYAPEYTKAKKSTWSPLVAASKWLNEMMGGDEDIAAGNSGKWMNPAVWQHLITNVGGGFAQLAGDVVAGVTDITEGKEIDPSNIPVMKRFYSGSSDERANWARFGIYKDYEKDYTLAKEKYQALDKRGLSLTERAAEVAKFAETHPKAAAIYAVWEGGIKGADIPQQLSKLGKDDPKYWDLVKDAVAKAEKAMNSGYIRAWEQKRKDRPDSMSDKELNDRFDKSDNDSIRHIMADEISKRAGSQDYYGRDAQAAWSDKSVAAWEAYQDQRTSDDIKADAELSNLLKVDEGEKDKERIKMLGYIKDELNKIRRGKDATSRSAGVKGLGEGDDGRVMNELRAARKQLIEDLKNGSAEQAYRNLERRTMRLGLRKKAKEL